MTFDQAAFDAGLDTYQARLAAEAAEAAERSYETAARRDAIPVKATFADLRVGDFMTNEGPGGRWVCVIEIRGAFSYRKSRYQGVPDGHVSVLFEIPEPVTVSGETQYWVDRPPDEPVWIDDAVRKVSA